VNHRGFTLLEVAVAMAVLGLGVVAAIQLFSGSVRLETGAQARTRAVLYARALFDQALSRVELTPGTEQGEYPDGYRWTRSVRLAEELMEVQEKGEEKEVLESELALFEVEVTVSWPESATREGVYTLRTIKVGPQPE